jgi:redox-sensitive bicupin YhaK (pirin superfamily)
MIKQIIPIDFQWPTQEPFLFCVHHHDRYPPGNKNGGLEARYLEDRDIGQDFTPKDGFRLYHGKEIPGFPVHPHRGFETITIVRKGYIDHADSLGAACRYGEGDVQWLTAGAGIQHSEMFPLLYQDRENTLELFQIWLNLPKSSKMAQPEFKILWNEMLPRIKTDEFEVTLISGEYQGHTFYQAPQHSWAIDPSHEVNILLVKVKPMGVFEYRPALGETNRTLYFFGGNEVQIDEERINGHKAVLLDSSKELRVSALNGEVEFLILEARPIGEPVVQYGPFVMNTKQEIAQTFEDFQRTEFGGWKWTSHDMVHGPKIERFARFPDGHVEMPHSL